MSSQTPKDQESQESPPQLLKILTVKVNKKQ